MDLSRAFRILTQYRPCAHYASDSVGIGLDTQKKCNLCGKYFYESNGKAEISAFNEAEKTILKALQSMHCEPDTIIYDY